MGMMSCSVRGMSHSGVRCEKCESECEHDESLK